MNEDRKGYSAATILIAVLVVVLIGLTAFLFYSQNQSEQKRQDLERKVSELESELKDGSDPNQSADPAEDATKSEDELILAAAGCDGDKTCKVKNKQATIAQVTTTTNGETINVYVAKEENGDWKTVYKGKGNVPRATQDKYNIPTAWTDSEN